MVRGMTKAVRKLEERVARLENEIKRSNEVLDKCIFTLQDVTKRLVALEDNEQDQKELSAIDLMHEYLTGDTSYKAERKK